MGVNEAQADGNGWWEREFVISQTGFGGGTLHVTQLHFVDWPDHGVPDSTRQFLNFLQRSMAVQKKFGQAAAATRGGGGGNDSSSGGGGGGGGGGLGVAGGSAAAVAAAAGSPPIIVHCSAGVGRSGVFCAVYAVMESLRYLGRDDYECVDVIAVVKAMRECRRYMVQTESQFRFCYEAISAGIDSFLQHHRFNASSSLPGSPAKREPAAGCLER